MLYLLHDYNSASSDFTTVVSANEVLDERHVASNTNVSCEHYYCPIIAKIMFLAVQLIDKGKTYLADATCQVLCETVLTFNKQINLKACDTLFLLGNHKQMALEDASFRYSKEDVLAGFNLLGPGDCDCNLQGIDTSSTWALANGWLIAMFLNANSIQWIKDTAVHRYILTCKKMLANCFLKPTWRQMATRATVERKKCDWRNYLYKNL